jgi:2-methylcitrate dehydratase PrpD
VNGHELAARFVAGARWEDLPIAVQRKARMCLADSLAATIAGTLTRVSRISADYASELVWRFEQAPSARALIGALIQQPNRFPPPRPES